MKIHFYIIYLINPKNITLQQVQGMDKNNGNSCERYTFLYYYGVGPPFAYNTACIFLGTDSCKIWKVSSEILYHSSSSCLRDVEGICFSPCSLKLTTVDRWYISWAIVLAREDVEVHFMLLKQRLNTSGHVYGRIVILKNCIIVRKQHLGHRMHLALIYPCSHWQ